MFRKILMPIDLQDSILAEKAINIAVKETREENGELYVLSVVPGFGLPIVASFFPDNAMEDAKKTVAAELRAYIKSNFPDDITIHPKIAEGNAAEMVLSLAEKYAIDLIIIPSHTQDLKRRMLGSCATNVILHAECPVIVVKGPAR